MDKQFEHGKHIIKRLQAEGHEAFFVGGYVRDRLLNIPTGDVDITTNATVEEVAQVFDKTVVTGEKYGTITVLMDTMAFEVTTYRTEGGYSDYRRPDQVTFTRSLEEDLKRRDFTINQLVMDADEHMLDHHDGLTDLKAGIIRTIGVAEARFKEDALRMLRAFRFVAKLGFTIEPCTLEAIAEHGLLIRNVAIERIQEEMRRIFNQPYRQKALRYMVEAGFQKALFDLSEGIEKLANISQDYDAEIAYAILYVHHPNIIDIFKLSKKNIQIMKQLARIHYQTSDEPFLPETLFSEGMEACLKANRINVLLGCENQKDRIESIAAAMPIKAVCDLAFKGEDIIRTCHIHNKTHIGMIIDHLVSDVINHRIENTYHALKNRAKTIKKDLEKSERP